MCLLPPSRGVSLHLHWGVALPMRWGLCSLVGWCIPVKTVNPQPLYNYTQPIGGLKALGGLLNYFIWGRGIVVFPQVQFFTCAYMGCGVYLAHVCTPCGTTQHAGAPKGKLALQPFFFFRHCSATVGAILYHFCASQHTQN